MKIILASNSPRRAELLKKFKYDFSTEKSNFDETIVPILPPKQLTLLLSFEKAKAVYKAKKSPDNTIIIGADTIVYFNKQILGKPKTNDEAVNMLKSLSGKKHFVYTGYCIIYNGYRFGGVVKSKVFFNKLTDAEIDNYVKSGLPFDKAGGYGIQDGFNLIKKYKGSYNNIVGLPIENVDKIIKKIIKKSK